MSSRSCYFSCPVLEVATFLVLVLYRLGSRQNSSLISCPITLVFTPFNSMRTPFSYGVCYNELRGRMRKLDTIKEMGKSHIWPYLGTTKWPPGKPPAVTSCTPYIF